MQTIRVERPLDSLHPQSMQALGFLEVTLAMLNNWDCMALDGHSIASGDLASWDVKNVGCHIAWECTLGCEHKALVVGVHTLQSWFWTPGIY